MKISRNKNFYLSFKSKVLQSGPSLPSDGLQVFETLFVFVQSFPHGPGLSWLQVNWLDGFAPVVFLEVGFFGLVDDSEDPGDVLPGLSDLTNFSTTGSGDGSDTKSSELLPEFGELFLELFFGVLADVAGAEGFGFFGHF